MHMHEDSVTTVTKMSKMVTFLTLFSDYASVTQIGINNF